jgi:hypothetical protein
MLEHLHSPDIFAAKCLTNSAQGPYEVSLSSDKLLNQCFLLPADQHVWPDRHIDSNYGNNACRCVSHIPGMGYEGNNRRRHE